MGQETSRHCTCLPPDTLEENKKTCPETFPSKIGRRVLTRQTRPAISIEFILPQVDTSSRDSDDLLSSSTPAWIYRARYQGFFSSEVLLRLGIAVALERGFSFMRTGED